MPNEYSFSINSYYLKDEFTIIERSILRALTRMYSDGVLNLAPKDIRIVDREQKEATGYKDIDSVIMSFYDEEQHPSQK